MSAITSSSPSLECGRQFTLERQVAFVLAAVNACHALNHDPATLAADVRALVRVARRAYMRIDPLDAEGRMLLEALAPFKEVSDEPAA